MMRKIKVRAWDTVGKQWLWITGFETAETSISDGYTLDGLFHDGDYVGREGIIVTQSTHLKDRNGKEIYEGDIVGYKSNDLKRYEKCVVCYDLYQAKYKAVPLPMYFNNAGNGGWTGYELRSTCEILGNIFEHSELMEKYTHCKFQRQ